LGSGIAHALDAWPRIESADDRDGCPFSVTVNRKPVDELILATSSLKGSPKSSSKTEQRIIELLRQYPYATAKAIGEILGINRRAVLKQVNKFKSRHGLLHLKAIY
jgi:hypothetical protein